MGQEEEDQVVEVLLVVVDRRMNVVHVEEGGLAVVGLHTMVLLEAAALFVEAVGRRTIVVHGEEEGRLVVAVGLRMMALLGVAALFAGVEVLHKIVVLAEVVVLHKIVHLEALVVEDHLEGLEAVDRPGVLVVVDRPEVLYSCHVPVAQVELYPSYPSVHLEVRLQEDQP